MSDPGGVAGLRTCVRMDTRELAPPAADALRTAVAALEGPAAASVACGRGADRFRYEISVVRGEREQRIAASEAELSEPARLLVRHLLAHGTRTPAKE